MCLKGPVPPAGGAIRMCQGREEVTGVYPGMEVSLLLYLHELNSCPLPHAPARMLYPPLTQKAKESAEHRPKPLEP